MGLFRRTPKGKHALGAAVTSIPSGPLRFAPPLGAVQPAREPAPVAPAAPSVMTSIAELIASGDAWASDPEDVHALHTPQPAHTPAPTAAPAPPPPAAPVPPRVQLGFRDGTSTTLDPESTQSRALEQLAQTLTRRD